MAKFSGEVGYTETTETAPGVWSEGVTERKYVGDVLRNTRRWQQGENLNDDLVVNNIISIVADPFANENIHTMRYVKWMGVYWKITNVEINRPRLILTLGGVYNGDTVKPADDTGDSTGL